MTPELQPEHSLRRLTAGLADIPPAEDLALEGLTTDSRKTGPGKLFLAVPGVNQDGRNFIAQALANGVSAVLYEAEGDFSPPPAGVPIHGVSALREKIGSLAARFLGQPSQFLLTIGITGTNGKTTCAHLLAQALERLGTRCGLLGTTGYGIPGALREANLTTPGAVELQNRLAELVQKGAAAVCMEVSSHGLDQRRVDDVAFDIAVFTNLSRDHIDYHGDIQHYGAAKARLFDFPSLRHAVINIDDPFGAELAKRLVMSEHGFKLWTYGLANGEIRSEQICVDSRGIFLTLAGFDPALEFRAPLFGRINLPNLLAVIATLSALGHSPRDVAAILPRLVPPPGRMELFSGGEGRPGVVVDYAHTPDALERALTSLREHTAGRLWLVFGCGGDRDRGKRPQMGRIAEQWADQVIVTDDNPRSEDPTAIAADIVSGMEHAPQIIHDRREAIKRVIRQAEIGDMILVAGKGHETTQTAKGLVMPFSDRQIVATLLENPA